MSNSERNNDWDDRAARDRPATASANQVLADLARDALTERVRSRRWKIFFRFLFAGLLLALLLVPLLGGLADLAPGAQGQHTAVVEVSGVIAAGSPAGADNVVDSLEQAFKSDQAAGIILRINSPGGSPVQSGIVFDEILRLRAEYPDTPVHAVILDVCASGGYYIAAAADRIYADKASIVGSIGVRLDSFGAVEAMEKLGIERRLITAGENKALLDPFLPENPAHRQHLQTLADEVHEQFIASVKRGRGERLKEDNSLFSGLFWSGEEALRLGLVDALASERSVARDVIGAERRVDYTKREGLGERILGRISQKVATQLFQHITWSLPSWSTPAPG